MSGSLPPYPAGPTPGSYDKTPAVVPANGLLVDGPDSTTIEIIAQSIGSPGTLVNMRAAFTTNGSTPVINPSDPVTSVTLGQNSTIQLVPPRTIGLVARPYLLKCVVEAVDANQVLNKFTAYFTLAFPANQPAITAVVPVIFLDGKQARISLDTANPPTIVTNLGVTTTTVFYKGEVIVNDPNYLMVVAVIAGSKNSQGQANLKFDVEFEPLAPPAFPTPGAPFAGTLSVGGQFTIQPEQIGYNLRGALLSRKLYAKVHTEDIENPNNHRRLVLELNIKSEKTVHQLDVYVRKNKTLFLLEDLPTQVEPEGTVSLIDATDTDTIEILTQPVGAAGTQILLREEHVPATDTIPPFPVLTDPGLVSYNQSGQQVYSDVSYMKGTYDIDGKIAILPARSGLKYREIAPGKAVKFRIDATSTVNVNNSVVRNFLIRANEQPVISAVDFFYMVTPNPGTLLPIDNTLAGSGTAGDPYIIEVDKPEQLQIFAKVTTLTPEGLAFVQTGFAYDQDPVTELNPTKPTDWDRAYSADMKVLVYPSPVPPPTQGQRAEKPRKPLTGEEIIVASGGTEVGDPGPDPGFSKNITLVAIATGVGAATNVIKNEVVIKVKDPAV